MEDLPDEFRSELGSRIAYGEDARLLEITHFDHVWGKAFASGLGANVGKIQAEVTRLLRLGIDWSGSRWRPRMRWRRGGRGVEILRRHESPYNPRWRHEGLGRPRHRQPTVGLTPCVERW